MKERKRKIVISFVSLVLCALALKPIATCYNEAREQTASYNYKKWVYCSNCSLPFDLVEVRGKYCTKCGGKKEDVGAVERKPKCLGCGKVNYNRFCAECGTEAKLDLVPISDVNVDEIDDDRSTYVASGLVCVFVLDMSIIFICLGALVCALLELNTLKIEERER